MKIFFRKNLVLFLIALISAAGFCALSYLTVLRFSVESEEQYITTCNTGVIDEIEVSLTFGKRLSNYYGLSQVLSRAREYLPEGAILTMADVDGGVLAATKEGGHFALSLSDYGVVTQSVRDEKGKTAGVLTTYYEKQPITDGLMPAVIKSIIGSLAVLAAAILAAAAIGVKRRLDSSSVAVVLMAAIILQGAILVIIYAGAFENVAQQGVKSVASYVSASVNSVLDKDVHVDEIADLDAFFSKVRDENAFIEEIHLAKAKDEVADENTYVEETTATDNTVLVLSVSEEKIRQLVISMILMFAATSFLSVIVMKESLTLFDMITFRMGTSFNTATDEQFDEIAKAIRYGNFLALTFDYMCLSFSALQIKEWNEGFFSISPVMAAALSISICQLADLFGMFAMPSIGKRIRGEHLMAVSAVTVIVSNVSCFLTHSVGAIIIMRFFAGVGTAGIKQVRNMVIAQGYSNESQRNQNLAASNNGVIGGLLCGMGLGGVVAGSFGYQATFLVAGVGHVLYLIFEAWCIPWELLSKRKAGTLADEEKGNLLVRILSIFRSVSVWRTIGLVVVPQYFLLMIIVCLIPGRIQSEGMSGVVLTYANLLNGVIGLYVGERLYRLLQRFIKNDLRIQIIMIITGAATLFVMDIPVFPVVMILLAASLSGIIDGVGSPVSTDIFMGNAYVMRYLNDTEILMLYSVIGSAVMAAAPFLLELCEKSIPWMYGTGIILLACALLLMPEARNRKIQ